MHGEQYDAFAQEFEAHAEHSAYNAYYDRPAVLDLLGDVAGKRVLDAGCGPGLYAAELLARGAAVTAFDESAEMVRLARVRAPAADIRQASLSRPLTWLTDATQDLVLMALVLHHLEDRVSALRELHRVLVPAGRLVISTTHPTSDWKQRGGSYFNREAIEETWHESWQVRYWRQPLEAWCAEFAGAGFVIERRLEPRPTPS
ncbi:MAG: class I SAM-dependent methyltransferase, partial [Actinomycetota bacterium]|nr:class I SAM-dependent methyltransferase [Actinomycetota bacterium]